MFSVIISIGQPLLSITEPQRLGAIHFANLVFKIGLQNIQAENIDLCNRLRYGAEPIVSARIIDKGRHTSYRQIIQCPHPETSSLPERSGGKEGRGKTPMLC